MMPTANCLPSSRTWLGRRWADGPGERVATRVPPFYGSISANFDLTLPPTLPTPRPSVRMNRGCMHSSPRRVGRGIFVRFSAVAELSRSFGDHWCRRSRRKSFRSCTTSSSTRTAGGSGLWSASCWSQYGFRTVPSIRMTLQARYANVTALDWPLIKSNVNWSDSEAQGPSSRSPQAR